MQKVLKLDSIECTLFQYFFLYFKFEINYLGAYPQLSAYYTIVSESHR